MLCDPKLLIAAVKGIWYVVSDKWKFAVLRSKYA